MSIKLPLTDEERTKLRKHKLKITEIASVPIDELRSILDVSLKRAKTLVALASFQQIPSIGPRMAENLIDLGYFSIDSFKGEDGAKLTDELEKLYGYQVDPCVEDQIRLVVYYADNQNKDKQWWDFTEERKAYRAKYGYPDTRPTQVSYGTK